MKVIHMIAFLLLVVGGINWLLVGALGTDVGKIVFGGQDAMPSKIIYVLVGLSAIFEIATHKSNCKRCSEGSAM